MLPLDPVKIRRKLLRWYEQNGRDLPWRKTKDPYAIWIAETMLQQTQVQTALPYYCRFLKVFPTLEALDRSREEKVLALWSGLGYYRRARNLKRVARILIQQYRGTFPRSLKALRALPGVGPYTAGALLSMAFGLPYPALDANARRVLSRLSGVREGKGLKELAQRLVSASRPGDWNQALMDLGSTLCLPQHPRCALCPLAQFCLAHHSQHFSLGRDRRKQGSNQRVEWPLLLMYARGRVLLGRKSPQGLLGGLWEIPGDERKEGESLRDTLSRCLQGSGQKMGPLLPLGEIHHRITYRNIRAPVFVCSPSTPFPPPHPNWRWVPLSSLHRYPLSSLSRKALALSGKGQDDPQPPQD